MGQQTILVCFFFQGTVSVVKITKNAAVDKKSSFIFGTLFGAQNARNGISELPDFKILWGTMPPDPPRLRGLTAPCSCRRLFSSNQLPTSNFIETPGDAFMVFQVLCLIDSLNNLVTWHRINDAGMQATQWDFQNKGKSGWTGTSSFVLKVPLCNLHPSIINTVLCDSIMQRAY